MDDSSSAEQSYSDLVLSDLLDNEQGLDPKTILNDVFPRKAFTDDIDASVRDPLDHQQCSTYSGEQKLDLMSGWPFDKEGWHDFKTVSDNFLSEKLSDDNDAPVDNAEQYRTFPGQQNNDFMPLYPLENEECLDPKTTSNVFSPENVFFEEVDALIASGLDQSFYHEDKELLSHMTTLQATQLESEEWESSMRYISQFFEEPSCTAPEAVDDSSLPSPRSKTPPIINTKRIISSKKGRAKKNRSRKYTRRPTERSAKERINQAASDASSRYKNCSLRRVEFNLGGQKVEYRFHSSRRLSCWKITGSKNAVDREHLGELIATDYSGSEDTVRITIEVDAWPLEFEWKDGNWEGVDYRGIGIIMGADSVRDLVFEQRLCLPIRVMHGDNAIALDASNKVLDIKF